MKHLIPFVALFLLISCGEKNTEVVNNPSKIKSPVATVKPHEMKIHGDTRIDNYFWMNERDSPEVLKYLEEENAFTKEKMAHTETFQKSLFEEMKGRIKESDESVPYKENGYFYITRYEEGKEYPIYTRKKGSLKADEEVLIDANKLAEGLDFFQVASTECSGNNSILAYAFDDESRRLWKVHFKNLLTGELLSDELLNTDGGIAWANDNKTVFYAKKDTIDLRTGEIWRHVLGTPQSEDILVFEEKDNTFNTGIYKTKSSRYLIIGSTSTLTSEYQYIDANSPYGDWAIFTPRERGLEYHVSDFNDEFYIRTNWDAQNFKLMKCANKNTNKENWVDVIPHRDDVLFEGMETFQDFLVLEERAKGLTGIRIINQNNKEDHYIEFQDEAYIAMTSYNPDFNADVLRYSYSSLTTPWSTYDYNMESREQVLLKQQEVLGSFSPDDYESKRIYAPASDGKEIPISLVYKKGLELNGSNPTLLYAYGSYGYSTDPSFRSTRLSLLDRGFVYAIAHIRGGEEMGRQWYEDGKLLKKMNTFTDFNDCASYLTKQKYTDSNHLCAMGGSAGGLLMGAIVNLQPLLYKGVIAAVPFVDVVTTMLDESIPLTTSEYDEWGNPNNKEYYDYMLSYSPYDQVKNQNYPNMLVTTGYHDSQVQYWEPAKWVAKLREMKTDDNLLLFDCNMDSGHGGASGRFEALKETALEYVFLMDLVGIDK